MIIKDKRHRIHVNNMHVYKQHISKHRFNMIKETCLFTLVAGQSILPQSIGDPHSASLLIIVIPENKQCMHTKK
jgi:hypothetical protein